MGGESQKSVRSRLVGFALARGLNMDDAEDVASDAWIRATQWAERTGPSECELLAYCFRIIKNLITDLWSSPHRVLSKRVAHVLAVTKGPDPIVSWSTQGSEFIGLCSQRDSAQAVPTRDNRIQDNLSEFLYSDHGLGGVSPSNLSTRFLITRLLIWNQAPIPRSILIETLIAIVSVPVRPVPLDMDIPGGATQEPTDLGARVWSLVLSLPYRMRAALLLGLDGDSLILLGDGTPPRLEIALNEWAPPPPLNPADLPFEDEAIASKLGIAKGYLHVIRSRAREIVRVKLAQQGDMPPEVT